MRIAKINKLLNLIFLNENLLVYFLYQWMKTNLFFFDYNDDRAIKVIKWTAGCICKCGTKNQVTVAKSKRNDF